MQKRHTGRRRPGGDKDREGSDTPTHLRDPGNARGDKEGSSPRVFRDGTALLRP